MRDSFKFRDLLLEYSFILSSAKSRFERGLDDENILDHKLYINIDWFHFMRNRLFKDEDIFEVITDQKVLSEERFLLPERLRCPGCEDGKPFKIIRYRNIDIPVYDDDYGQQDFAFIDGESVSGGCYNMFASEEFISYVDRMLENRYLKNEYDIHKEVDALYPEWEEKK